MTNMHYYDQQLCIVVSHDAGACRHGKCVQKGGDMGVCVLIAGARVDLTWGPLPYHMDGLRNLQLATKKARKLCCVMVDTLGRELMIRRQVGLCPLACFNCTGLCGRSQSGMIHLSGKARTCHPSAYQHRRIPM